MNQLFNYIFLLLLLTSTSAVLTSGSCQRYSALGQKCQQCVDNYHLDNGQCYVDILGCKRYTFGNICQQCSNGYVLVNNLCCDQVCMSKILKRHISKTKSETVSKHFNALNQIIPQITKKYIKDTLYNLVEIDYQQYQDINRYILLFQVYTGGFIRYRSIIDYDKDNQIIQIDWKKLQSGQEYLAVNKKDLLEQEYTKILKIFSPKFSDIDISKDKVLIKSIKFSQITQYQITTQCPQTDKISYNLIYLSNNKQITLRAQTKSMLEFEPYQLKYITKSQIDTQLQKDDILRKIIKLVKDDKIYQKYKDSNIIKINKNANNRQITHYAIVVQNQQVTLQYFIDHFKRKDQLVIVDINTIQKIKTKGLSQYQLKLLENIRKNQKNLESLVIIQVWKYQFRVFSQVTILGKIGDKYYYFYFHDQSGNLVYLGMQKSQLPQVKDSGQYKLLNPQRDQSPVDKSIKSLIKQVPQAQGKLIVSHKIRQFPLSIRRTIVIRLQNSITEYIIRQTANAEYKIIEKNELQNNLPVVSQVQKDIIKVVNEIKEDIKDINDNSKAGQIKNDPYLQFIAKQSGNLQKNARIIFVWEKQSFKRYQEITLLVQQTNRYRYFYLMKQSTKNQLIYLGYQQTQQPTKNQQNGNYILPNPQQEKSESLVSAAIQEVHQKHTQTVNYSPKKILVRKFPLSTRILLKFRLQTTLVRYIVLETGKVQKILEEQVLRQGLQPLTKTQKQQQKIVTKILKDHPDSNVPDQCIEKAVQKETKKPQKQIKIDKTPIIGISTITKSVTDQQTIKYTKYLIKYSKEVNEVQPIKTFRNKFCNTNEIVIVYRFISTKLTYYSLRQTLNDHKIQYLGVKQLTIDQNLESDKIVDITLGKVDNNKIPNLLKLVQQKKPQLIKPDDVTVRNFQNEDRYILVFSNPKQDDLSDRFIIIVPKDTSLPSYLLQQCRVNRQHKYTYDTINQIQVETVSTNKIDQLKQNDKNFVDVINYVNKEIKELKSNGSPIDVTITHYNKVIRYVIIIHVETIYYKVIVIHSKKDSTNKVIYTSQVKYDKHLQQPVSTSTTPLSSIVPLQPEDPKKVLTPQKELVDSITKQAVKEGIIDDITHTVITKEITTKQDDVKEVSVVYQDSNNKQKDIIVTGVPTNQGTVIEDVRNKPEPQIKIPVNVEVIKDIVHNLQNEKKQKQGTLIKTDEVSEKLCPKQTLGTISTTHTQIKSDGQLYQTQTKPQQYPPQIQEIIKYIKTNDKNFKQENIVSLEQHISQVGIDFAVTLQNEPNKYYRYYCYKIIKNNNLYYLGSENIENYNQKDKIFKPQIIFEDKKQISKYSQLITILTNDKNNKQFNKQDIKKLTYRKYPKGNKFTAQLQTPDLKIFAISHVLIDHNEANILVDYHQQTVEVIKKLEIQVVDGEDLTKSDHTRTTLEQALSYVKTQQPQLQEMQLKSNVKNQLPHTTIFEMLFEKQKDKNTKVSISIIVNCKNLKSCYLASVHKEETSVQTVIENVIKQIEQKQLTKYTPIDPNVLSYQQATQILNTIPLKELQQILQLDNIPQQLQQVILYVRTHYQIIRVSTIIKIIKNPISSKKDSYKIYFYTGSNQQHPTYRIYQVQVIYSKQDVSGKVFVLTFKLVIDAGKILREVSLEDNADDVDIAYGYKSMSLTTAQHDQNVQIIKNQIKLRYSNLLQGTSLSKVQYLQLKDGRVNYKINFKYDNMVQQRQYKFVIFYQPTLQKVIILNSINQLNHPKINQLSSTQRSSDNLLQKISQSYLLELHPKQLQQNKYKIACVGKLLTQQGYQYHIQLINTQTSKKYRSIINVDSNNNYNQLSWNQVVEISLDHYRLDQFQKSYITNFQKLSKKQMQANSYFKLINNYAKHQNKLLSTGLLLGAASKPSNLGFLYRVYYRLDNGDIFQSQIYIESFSQKISLILSKKLTLVGNLIPLKTQDQAISKMIDAIKTKAQFSGSYIVNSAAGKEFMFGNLYQIILEVTMNGQKVSMEGFLYHDYSSEELHLLSWKKYPNKEECLKYSDKNSKECIQCSFNAPILNNKCTLGVQYCKQYVNLTNQNEQECKLCEDGYLLVSNICTKDCGALCNVFAQ